LNKSTENHAYSARRQISERPTTLIISSVGPYHGRWDAAACEHARHVPRMLNTDAKAEGTNAFPAAQPISELVHYRIRPDVCACDRVSEALNVITGTPAPRDIP
jgi:hypothetical protein